MATFTFQQPKTKLDGTPAEQTGAQGFGTPAAQQNAAVQGLGGSGSSPSGQQSPAEKLLQLSTTFPPAGGPPPPATIGPSDLAQQLFPIGDQPPTPFTGGSGVGGPMPHTSLVPTTPQGETPNGNGISMDAPPVVGPSTTSSTGPAMGPPPAPGGDPGAPGGTRSRPSAPPTAPGPALPRPSEKDMQDPTIAAHWYASTPGFEDVTSADVNMYRSNPQGMDFATWYKQTGGARAAAGPKPDGTEDPAVAAAWYAKVPGFEGVTVADVNFYRSNANGMNFSDWWLKGNRAPTGAGPGAGGPPTVVPTRTPSPGDADFVIPPGMMFDPFRGLVPIPPPAAPGAPPVAPPATPPVIPPTTTPPPAPGSGPSGPSLPPPDPVITAPGAPGTPPPDLPMPDVSKDPWTQMLQKALAAQKDAGANQIRRQVTAAQAATGGMNQGGFGGAIATPIADFSAQVDAKGAELLSGAHNSAMDRALQESMSQRVANTQLQLGNMDVLSKKYTADQALEGEKFRAQIDQAIASAQNSSQEKISAAVNSKDLTVARMNADAAAQIAASNAAGAAAQAGASLAAQKYASDLAYQGTIQKIAQDREASQLNFNLGIAGLGQKTFSDQLQNNQVMMSILASMGPEKLAQFLFGGQQLPGSIFTTP